jgi:ABC-2 type transport system ATP-binding protein
VTIRSQAPLTDVRTLAEWALGRGLDLPDLDVHRPRLEDVYLALTNGKEES